MDENEELMIATEDIPELDRDLEGDQILIIDDLNHHTRSIPINKLAYWAAKTILRAIATAEGIDV